METEKLPLVAVLFARSDSNYKADPRCDVYDAKRDATTYRGQMPVIAHPPCRAWGRLRTFAKPRAGEKALAVWAISQVRTWGGVLEHPAASTLWPALALPAPGSHDRFGGWTLTISQDWWGHRAQKLTRLYIVGTSPAQIPPLPLRLGEPTHVIAQSRTRCDGTHLTKGMPGWKPEVTRQEREHTPPSLAAWLTDLAITCARIKRPT